MTGDASPQRIDGLLEIRVYPTPQAHPPPGSPVPKNYQVELRFEAGQAQNEPVRGAAPISLSQLFDLRGDSRKYGETLSAAVFSDTTVKETFIGAKASVGEGALRIVLMIDPAAPELHAIRWELLTDPTTNASFAKNQNTPFSRFLYGRDWTPLPLLRKQDWKVLVAVANPSNFALTEVKPKEYIELVRESLGNVHPKVLERPVTLDALMRALSDGVDILYLVCHGIMKSLRSAVAEDYEIGFGEDEDTTRENDIRLPYLFLEDPKPVSGGRFARRLADELKALNRPRLIVLASCQSGGVEGDWTGESARTSVARRLARAGVPALIAMQGDISMKTAQDFIKPFFKGLAKHGSIDQAMAAARSAIRDQPDFWMPALQLRLKDGRFWYEPSFSPGAKVNFQGIADQLKIHRVTPIVGWGLGEAIYGTKAGLSERIALEKRVPLEQHRLGELPLVSQYLQLTASDGTALLALKERMRLDVLERFQGRIDANLETLDDVLKAAGKVQRAANPNDPYRIVAQLEATVFINASPDCLLEEALREAGKEPTVRTTKWQSGSSETAAEQLNPSVRCPLILHVFGRFTEDPDSPDWDSLVLFENDFLDYLMGIAQNEALMPSVAKTAITNKALMFLGFQLTDWSFRVLFRAVMRLMSGVRNQRGGFPNVAVQVEPDGSLFAGAEEARNYLQKFYGPSNIDSYWGTSEDFLSELLPKLPPFVKKPEGGAGA